MKLGFSLVLYMKLRQFLQREQDERSRLLFFCGNVCAIWLLYIELPNQHSGLWGRELFAFIRCGQSKASGR